MVVTPINQRRIERNRRRVEKLRVWRNAREEQLSEIRFRAGSGETIAVSLGATWPEIAT